MVIYEVNLEVDASIADAFKKWLPGHIREVLQCRGFQNAEWFTAENAGTGNPISWTIQYRITDRESLEEYFSLHAPRFRQEGIDKFGGKFTAARRILHLQNHSPSDH